MASCRSCPEGGTTSGPGATKLSACTCAKDRYFSLDATTYVATCPTCPEGFGHRISTGSADTRVVEIEAREGAGGHAESLTKQLATHVAKVSAAKRQFLENAALCVHQGMRECSDAFFGVSTAAKGINAAD